MTGKKVENFLKSGVSKQDTKTKKAAKIAHGLIHVDQDLQMRKTKMERAVEEARAKSRSDEQEVMKP